MKIPKLLQLMLPASLLLAYSASAQFFTGVDLGGPTYAGSVVTNGDGSLDVSGGGGDIWGNNDQCYYFYSWASGQQWDATVQMVNLYGPDWWTKGELMVRWSDPNTGPRGNDAFIGAMATQTTGQNEINDQFRSARSAGANSVAQSSTWRPSFPNQWMRINRNGSVFSVFFGPDGVNWTNYISIDTASTTPVGGSTFGQAWPDAVTVGLAVTAHNDGSPSLGVANFQNLHVTFPAIQPPTTMSVATQVGNATNYAGSEASFTFVTTNNAQPAVVTWPTYVAYQWYKNGTAITGATGTSYSHLINPYDGTENGSKYHCIATILPPFNSTVASLTSSTGSVTVVPGALFYTNGLKMEFFANGTRGQVESGSVPAGVMSYSPNVDIPDDTLRDYARRLSGWFIPPVTTNYVFFLASDDDTDVYLNLAGMDPSAKQLIAQETGWSGYRVYTNSSGSINSQKRSDTWTNDLGVTPFTNGIPLTAGQPYYLEVVHHEGAPTDNLSLTYQYWYTNLSADLLTPAPTNGTPSLLAAGNHNLVLITSPTTNLVWVFTPTNTTVTEGHTAAFYAKAHSDTEMLPLYQWYRGGSPIAGATSTTLLTAITTPADNGANFFVVASTPEGGFSITSSVVALTVASPILETGWANVEFWAGKDRPSVENGTAGVPTYTTTSPGFEAGLNGESGDGYARRVSGFFIPPATDDYVFFVSADDDADLFLSTDTTPANKRLIAQEIGWGGGVLQWLAANWWDGTATVSDPWVVAQTRSDQWTNSAGATPYASGIHLIGGQKYYLEAVQHDGSGGDYFSATFKRLNTSTANPEPDPLKGQDSRLRGNVIAMYATRCTSVAITQPPADQTSPPTQVGAVSFSASATTDSQTPAGVAGDPRPLVSSPVYAIYQWQKNGTDIPGATASTFSYYGPILPSDDGAMFTCKVRALGYADNNLNPVWVTSAPARLTVSPKVQMVNEPGLVMVQHWDGKVRTDVETGNVGAPAWNSTTPEFEVSTNNESGDSYARRLSGFFTPATTDDYVFWINCDDDADLFLSTDASPLNKRLVARADNWGNQFSWNSGNATLSLKRSDQFSDWASGLNSGYRGIHLVAGQKYYLEAVHHEGTGGDNVEVTVSTISGGGPADGTDTILSGSLINSLAPPSTVAITNQPQSITLTNYATLVLTVGARTDSQISFGNAGDIRNDLSRFLKYQWFKNNNAIAGATTSRYSQTVLPDENGSVYMCALRSVGLGDAAGNPVWSNSTPATLSIITNAPHLLYCAYYVNSNWMAFTGNASNYVTLVFDSAMDPGQLSQLTAYTLGGGLIVTGVQVNSNDYRSVTLNVTGTPTFPFSLTLNGNVVGLGGGLHVANATMPVNPMPLTDLDIGSPGADPAIPGMVLMAGPDAFTIACEGSDIWNNADGFNFLYEMKTNDFDVVVRQKNTRHTSNWAKGGLMVRETLDAGSRNWNIVNDPLASDGIPAPDGSGYGNNVVECNARVLTGGGSGGWDFVPRTNAPAFPNAWVRLTRTGNILKAYYSSDAVNWLYAAVTDPSTNGDMTPLPSVVYVGLCTTAHNNDNPGTPEDQLLYLNVVDYANYNSSYVYVQPPTVKATLTGNNIVVTWTPTAGHLWSSPAVVGPAVNWQLVPGGTGGSVTLPRTAGPVFFRVINP